MEAQEEMKQANLLLSLTADGRELVFRKAFPEEIRANEISGYCRDILIEISGAKEEVAKYLDFVLEKTRFGALRADNGAIIYARVL